MLAIKKCLQLPNGRESQLVLIKIKELILGMSCRGHKARSLTVEEQTKLEVEQSVCSFKQVKFSSFIG